MNQSVDIAVAICGARKGVETSGNQSPGVASLPGRRAAQAAKRRPNRPDGQISDLPVQPFSQKYSDFPKTQITL
jgi:hypothetical protein